MRPTGREGDGNASAFCSAALAWDYTGEILQGTSLTGASSGYPDARVIADPTTVRPLPWRSNVGHVICDIWDEHGALLEVAPRTVLKRMVARLADLGYQARIGLESEFYLLTPSGDLPATSIHAYSLQNAAAVEPFVTSLTDALQGFVSFEAINAEQGPGQFEVNVSNQDPVAAVDDAFRLRYAVREIARQSGRIATFMAKPHPDVSGSSSHIHLSLWKDSIPQFGGTAGGPNEVMSQAIAGLAKHLPGITLMGSPTVNSYKRFRPDSFAPTRVNWAIDNRTVAIRALTSSPSASRIELRTPAADSNPYWSVAAALAAVIAGLEGRLVPPPAVEGYSFGEGGQLPLNLGEAMAATRSDPDMADLLGKDAVDDLLVIATAEWQSFVLQVTEWDRARYLPLH